jgi:ATP-dependent RNA circularization protein (DNA/RNA ligase family)
MGDDFFKFPSTPHLTVLGNATVRGDKVVSRFECEEFLKHELIIEEKVDGANLGISFDASGNLRCQNRGDYLYHPYTGQWKKFPEWLEPKIDTLFDELTDRYILFGEWCYAQHSVFYDQLPDWFLGFDVYDKKKARFVSCTKRKSLCLKLGLSEVPFLKQGHFTLAELGSLISDSSLGNMRAEGIYVRYDQGDWLGNRAKIVGSEFIQSIEKHWSCTKIKTNQLKVGATSVWP